MVRSVHPKGPAERAGLAVGDVILTVGGFEIQDPEALRFRLGLNEVGGEVEIGYLRKGVARKASLALRAAPEDPPRDETVLDGRQPMAGAKVVNLSPAVAEEFGFRIGTFQHVLEGYKVADEIRESAIGASSFSDWWGYKIEVQDAIPHDGAIMHSRGVVVSFNSDSDELARRMNTEAAKATRYGGVEAEEALKFVTINPAIQLNIQHRVGSLEANKDADIAVWSGPPMSTLSRCVSTWVDGREYFSIEKDRAHRESIAKERERIIQKILAKGDKKEEGPPAGPGGAGRRQRPGEEFASAEEERFFIARREYYLDLYRRGITPADASCGATTTTSSAARPPAASPGAGSSCPTGA